MYTLRQLKKRMAHDHLVRQFGELFLYYKETRNTSSQYWTLNSAEVLGITYDVCRFVSEGLLPFEKYIDTSLIHDQTENGNCFLRELLHRDKRLSLRIRRGKKKKFS
jgi:hypothetical protein